MYIRYKFKVNALSIEKGVASITYTPVDSSLGLNPFNIQQLHVSREAIVDYSAGDITLEQLQTIIRTEVVNADALPQDHWNAVLLSQRTVIPADLNSIFGEEQNSVSEQESMSLAVAMETL